MQISAADRGHSRGGWVDDPKCLRGAYDEARIGMGSFLFSENLFMVPDKCGYDPRFRLQNS